MSNSIAVWQYFQLVITYNSDMKKLMSETIVVLLCIEMYI